MNQSPLTCVIIGGSSLLQRCAEVLQRRGHHLAGIVTEDTYPPDTASRFSSLEEAMEALSDPPDVLFSIVSRRLLKREHLDWPRLAAINYHDSPLPRLAGVNATSWAIMNGEVEHGVTWHLMTPLLDAGDICAQHLFAVDAEETALSLNLKCYEHGLEAFETLLSRLERGETSGLPQDLSKRTVFPSTRRLPRNGIVSWRDPVDAIRRCVRAGHLGPYDNDFGLAKIVLPDGSLMAVGKAVLVAQTGGPPGTVLQATGHSLTVAAVGGVICLEELTPLGESLPEDLDRFVGRVLPELPAWEIALIESTDRLAAKDEFFWITTLPSLEPPITLPQLHPEKSPEAAGVDYILECRLPASGTASDVLARVTQQLATIAGREAFTIGLLRPPARGFAPILPVRVESTEIAAISDALAAAGSRSPCPMDLPARFPHLRTAAMRLAQIRIVLCEGEPPPGRNPGLIIASRDGGLWLHFAADQISREKAGEFVHHLASGAAGTEDAPSSTAWAHDLVSKQAAANPAKIAVEMGCDSITYAGIEARANRLAWLLRRRGAAPESRVALLFPRSIDFIVGVLAVLKAGAAYMPLDVEMPLPRLRDIILDAKPLLVLCPATCRRIADRLDAPVLVPDEHLVELAALPEAPPPGRIEADHLAYIIYTSGSSGSPKGSMIEHGALAHFLVQDVVAHSITPDDRILQLCALVFDASVEEMFSSLVSGATLVLRPPDLLDSVPGFLDFCDASRLTVIGLFAAMLPDVLAAMEHRGSFPASVRLATTGGERIAAADVRRWQRFFQERGQSGPRLVNVYGLTETTVANLLCDLSHASVEGDEVPVGGPLPGNLVRVVDAHLLPVEDGTVGELLLGGPQLARAYLGRPRLNSERFFRDPADGTRWFRTGDAVRRLPGGEFTVVGRLDRQLKIRGYRIELKEIEAALRRLPAVEEAVVIPREDAPLVQLAGYLRLGDGAQETPEILRQQLRQCLPEYMVPTTIVVLEKMPLLPSGKIDHRSLLAQGVPREPSRGKGGAPANLLEWKLLDIWQRLFGRQDIGRQDNFFDIGGHSLLAAHLAAEIDRLLGCRLPIATLFQTPTVELLARRFGREDWVPPWSSLVPLQPLGANPPLFLVHGRGGDIYVFLGLAGLLSPEQPVYGIQAVGLDGTVEQHRTVGEMAAHYVREIRSLQQDGPYFLAGYSLGGSIAFEVARQLHRLGQRVAFLGLIDSVPTGVLPWTIYVRILASYLPARFLFHLRRWWQMPGRDRRDFFRTRWRALRYWLTLNRPKPDVVTPPPQEDIRPPQVSGFDDYYVALASKHRLHEYPGVADVFVSDDEAYLDWISSWKHLVRGGVSFHRVTGSHDQILSRDHLPVLAKSLRNALQKAQTKKTPPQGSL